MRISDWSSDVCSSDLVVHEAGDVVLVVGEAPHVAFERIPHQPARTALSPPIEHGDGKASPPKLANHLEIFLDEQIGRASCRERVVSVRVDLGGRRVVKKKNKTTRNEAKTHVSS